MAKKDIFPKIAAQATIKKVVMCDKANIVFNDLEFSPDQYAQLERWRCYSDKILITLEQVQSNMNDSQHKSMQQTVTATEDEV